MKRKQKILNSLADGVIELIMTIILFAIGFFVYSLFSDGVTADDLDFDFTVLIGLVTLVIIVLLVALLMKFLKPKNKDKDKEKDKDNS